MLNNTRLWSHPRAVVFAEAIQRGLLHVHASRSAHIWTEDQVPAPAAEQVHGAEQVRVGQIEERLIPSHWRQ